MENSISELYTHLNKINYICLDTFPKKVISIGTYAGKDLNEFLDDLEITLKNLRKYGTSS